MKAVTPLSALLTSLRLMILTPDIPGGYNSWPRTSPEDTITLKDKHICLEALSPWVWMDTFNPSEEVPERYPRITLEVSKMYPRSTQEAPQIYPEVPQRHLRGTPEAAHLETWTPLFFCHCTCHSSQYSWRGGCGRETDEVGKGGDMGVGKSHQAQDPGSGSRLRM